MSYINVKSDNLYSNIANTYSESSTYSVGSYCYYNNNIYRCITAITTAEPFDPTKWTQVILTNELGGGSVDLSCIAPLYDEAAEYHANDIVLHDGKVYYCKGDSATGPWTPSEWIECPISKLLIYDAIAPIWSTQYEYQSGQWTTYRGHLYICAVETSTQGEFKDDEWYKISIDKTLHSMVHSIIEWTAPWFNEYENYEKNSYVMHLQDPSDVSSARLYKAKYNLVAGAWAQDDWEETTIVAMREDLAYQKSVTRDVWSENAEYSYGDIVMYKGKLCKAVVDTPTKGEFKNDEWDFTDTFTELKLTVSNLYVKGAGKTYYPGDIIQADGGIYKAVTQTTDTNPFSPVQETEESASLTAVAQGTNVYMAATEAQSSILAATAMAGSGKVNIKYIGTVDGVDINETVECTFAMANRAYIGTLSNGWTLIGALMMPTPPYPFALMIMDGSTTKLVAGDTATVAIISSIITWKQIYIDREPLPTFVIKNDHDLALWLEGDTNYNYTVVSLAADVSYSGNGGAATYTNLFIGNNHTIIFKLPTTLKDGLYSLPKEMKDTHIKCVFENGATYTSDSDTDISLFNINGYMHSFDMYTRNKFQNCSFYLTNEGTTPAYFNTTVITKLRLFNSLSDTEYRWFNDCSFRTNLTIDTTTSLTDFYFMYESNYYFYKHAFANNCDFYIVIKSSTGTDKIIDNFILSRGVKHSKSKIMVTGTDIKNFWCVDTYAEGCDIEYQGDCLNFYGIYGSNTIATGNKLESWIIPSATIHATACTYLDPIATNNLNRSASFTNNIIYNINQRLAWSDYVTITNHHNNHAYDRYTATTADAEYTTIEVWNDDVKANDVSIAAEFVAGGTYTVGQFVMYKNDLYKCNTAGTYASWDATKFTQTKVTDELGGGGGAVDSVNGKTGTVVLTGSDIKVEDATTSVSIKDAFDNVQLALNNVYTKTDTYSKSEVNTLISKKVNDIAITYEFSESTAYTAGTYVMHNGDLYKAKVDMSAGTWSASKWQMEQVMDLIGGGSQVWDPVSDAYDETKTYIPGDICINNNKLYRCIVETTGTFTDTDWSQTSAAKLAAQPYSFVIRDNNDFATFMTCSVGPGETITTKFRNVGFSIDSRKEFTYNGNIADFSTVFDSSHRCRIDGNGAKITVKYEPDYDDVTKQWRSIFMYTDFYDVTVDCNLTSTHERDIDFAMFDSCTFHDTFVNITDAGMWMWRDQVTSKMTRIVYNCSEARNSKFYSPDQTYTTHPNINLFSFVGDCFDCEFNIGIEVEANVNIIGILASKSFSNNKIEAIITSGTSSSAMGKATVLSMNSFTSICKNNVINVSQSTGSSGVVISASGVCEGNRIEYGITDVVEAYGITTSYEKAVTCNNNIRIVATRGNKIWGIKSTGSIVSNNEIFIEPLGKSTFASWWYAYAIYTESKGKIISDNNITMLPCTGFDLNGIYAIAGMTVSNNTILYYIGTSGQKASNVKGIFCAGGGNYIVNNTIDCRLHDAITSSAYYINCTNTGRYKIANNTIIHGALNSGSTATTSPSALVAIKIGTDNKSLVRNNMIFNRCNETDTSYTTIWKLTAAHEVPTGLDVTTDFYDNET